MPPTKLNPFRTGSSKSKGDPERKYTIIGKKIIDPRIVKNTGYCLPVSSCFLFAHREKKMDEIITKTKVIVTYIKLSPKIG